MTSTRSTTHPRRPHRRRLLGAAPALLAAAVVLAAACTPATGTAQRVSVAGNGSQLDGTSFAARLSRTGRFVAFSTTAESLVPLRTTQVFRKDRTTGKLRLISLTEDGEPFRGRNIAFDISGDGTKVAFTNIVRDEFNLNDIETAFVRDLTTNRTIPVGVTLTGLHTGARDPDLSTDGRFVAFSSTSANLVAGDTNNDRDVFVQDLASAGSSTRRASLSVGGNEIPDGGDLPRVSADGRFVLFRTTQNLVGEDTDDNEDVYVRDTLQSTTTFESLAGIRTFARDADISADGRFVAFAGESGATTQAQAFVRDRTTGSLTVISHEDGSTVESGNLTFDIDISEDGRHVAFTSVANDMVPGDTNGELDVFVSSSAGGRITRLSLRPGGQQTTRANIGGEVADGGKVVLFQSDDAEIVAGDTNGTSDVFVHAPS